MVDSPGRLATTSSKLQRMKDVKIENDNMIQRNEQSNKTIQNSTKFSFVYLINPFEGHLTNEVIKSMTKRKRVTNSQNLLHFPSKLNCLNVAIKHIKNVSEKKMLIKENWNI